MHKIKSMSLKCLVKVLEIPKVNAAENQEQLKIKGGKIRRMGEIEFLLLSNRKV